MSLIKIYVNNEIAELKEKDEITSGDISTVDIEFAFSSGGAMSRFSTNKNEKSFPILTY